MNEIVQIGWIEVRELSLPLNTSCLRIVFISSVGTSTRNLSVSNISRARMSSTRECKLAFGLYHSYSDLL